MSIAAAATGFWGQIEEARERWDVLEHPFYRRWAEGALGAGELATYASEFDHAVVATAALSRRAAGLSRGALEADAREQEAQVSRWRGFAKATGWGPGSAWHYSEDPLPETVVCAQVWDVGPGRPLDEYLATLYAIASVQPVVSRMKLDGLLRHYRFADGPATEYFQVNPRLSGDATVRMRATLDQLLPEGDPAALVRQVEDVHRSHWNMLDGVQSLSER